ncbi:MAG: hypothetical protein JWP48_2252 [Actinoallomurus sp.]|nr:hypothetical protein [Actinoallomurus sp.]
MAIIGGGAGLWWVASGLMVYGPGRGDIQPLVPVAVPPISRRQRLIFGLGLAGAIMIAVMIGPAFAGTVVFSVCELMLLRMHRTVSRTESPQRDRR